MGKSTYQRKVDALSKAASTLTMRGKVFEEAEDTITFEVGNSLFEIPRESILSITDVEGAEIKTVDVSIDREAKIIQKTLVTPDLVIGAISSGTGSGYSPNYPSVCQRFCQYCHICSQYCVCYCNFCQFCHCDPLTIVSDEQVIQKTFRAKQQKIQE